MSRTLAYQRSAALVAFSLLGPLISFSLLDAFPFVVLGLLNSFAMLDGFPFVVLGVFGAVRERIGAAGQRQKTCHYGRCGQRTAP